MEDVRYLVVIQNNGIPTHCKIFKSEHQAFCYLFDETYLKNYDGFYTSDMLKLNDDISVEQKVKCVKRVNENGWPHEWGFSGYVLARDKNDKEQDEYVLGVY